MKGRTRANLRNPFGLTYRECEVLSGLIRLGSPKAVAAEEGCNAKTVRNLTRTAMRRIGAKTVLQAVVEFDRKRREETEFHGKRGTANSVFALAANESERQQA
jgi:DNA-binding CsgD family transcriptional regulator